MVSETVQVSGHILDSLILPKILDEIIDLDGTFEILEIAVGKRKTDPSTARLKVGATSEQKLQAILKRLARLGATPLTLREVQLVRARQDGVFPTDFYSTTNLPTAVRYQGRWRSVENIEMDCGIVIDPRAGRASCVPVTHVRKGDLVVCGTTGVRVTPLERSRHKDVFQFMGSAVSSEKPKGLLVADVAARMALLRHHDVDALRHSLAQAAAQLGLSRFVTEVVVPMNALVGDAWLRGELQIFEEHLYTEAVTAVLRHGIHTLPPGAPHRPRVLLTTFPKEPHSLGLLMAAVFVAGTLMNTAQSSLPALAAGFYPTHGRATGVAWMLGLGRFGGIAGSFLVAELTRRQLPFAGIFTIVAIPGLIAAAAPGGTTSPAVPLLPGGIRFRPTRTKNENAAKMASSTWSDASREASAPTSDATAAGGPMSMTRRVETLPYERWRAIPRTLPDIA